MHDFDERLSAPRSWWLIAFFAGVALGLIVLPYGALPMLGGLVVGAVLTGMWVSAQGSLRIRVVSGLLIAGDARIPVSALGKAEALTGEEARAWRTYKADLRAHSLVRTYIPTAVRVEVADSDDPTPYVYLSTREPEGLVAALESAQMRTVTEAGTQRSPASA
jgi:hypothetical protein